ncbi:methyl farnesoate epoxidase-like [Ischnura elegans]|uniref:methyl farnesoate epoxidase-like n=1 Tax=Ischnura elegans TaxID=197161 RepID=UPI001ED88D51|nr:methyl farnesoate epoxidase-like [Ischnura elegans]
MWILAAIIFCLVAAFLGLAHSTKRPPHYPPGPTCLPLIGCSLHVVRLVRRLGFVHNAWEHLAREYGPFVGLKMGPINVVLVSGAQAAASVLADRRFDARPDNFFFRMRTFGDRLGLVFSDGELWQVHRRFCLRHLRDVNGLGSRRMEGLLQREAATVVGFLRDRAEREEGGAALVSFNSFFDLPTLNVVWSMVAGGTIPLAREEKALTKEEGGKHDPLYLLELVRRSFGLQDISGGILGYMPWLRHVVPSLVGYDQLRSTVDKMHEFLRATVAEHRENLNADGCPEDLIEAYLMEMNTANPHSSFTDEQLLSVCMDLFMAGVETTANTLSFGVLLLLKHPEVRKKAVDQLDRVVGKGRIPSLGDRANCPYVEAVIMEVLRRSNVVPVDIPHRAVCDVVINGYQIPKDTAVLISLRSVHMDKEHWGDPENFRPERFIDESGNVKNDTANLLAFGGGRRRCMAESLARATLFIFLSSMLLNFDLQPTEDPLPSCLAARDGVTLSPLPFRGRVVLR